MKFKDDKFNSYLSGGYTLFKNKFNAKSDMGIAISNWRPVPPKYYMQQIDVAKVPITISDSWTGHGINIGAGIYYKKTEILAVTADIRYYYCPLKDMYWFWNTGTYAGVDKSWVTLNIDSETAAIYEDATTGFTVNPSFFVISVGFKIFIK